MLNKALVILQLCLICTPQIYSRNLDEAPATTTTTTMATDPTTESLLRTVLGDKLADKLADKLDTFVSI